MRKLFWDYYYYEHAVDWGGSGEMTYSTTDHVERNVEVGYRYCYHTYISFDVCKLLKSANMKH